MGIMLILFNVATIISLAFSKGVKPGDKDPVYRLECPAGRGIKIKGVYWGNKETGCDPKANFDEHTNLVKSSCDNRPRCEVPVAFQLFGINIFPNSSCLWATLELNIDYKCNSGIESVNDDEGGAVKIECPLGTRIKIIKAYYGRDIHSCPSVPGTTEKITTLCNRRNLCTLRAKAIFYNPYCPSLFRPLLGLKPKLLSKQLDVSFKCKKYEDGSENSKSKSPTLSGHPIINSNSKLPTRTTNSGDSTGSNYKSPSNSGDSTNLNAKPPMNKKSGGSPNCNSDIKSSTDSGDPTNSSKSPTKSDSSVKSNSKLPTKTKPGDSMDLHVRSPTNKKSGGSPNSGIKPSTGSGDSMNSSGSPAKSDSSVKSNSKLSTKTKSGDSMDLHVRSPTNKKSGGSHNSRIKPSTGSGDSMNSSGSPAKSVHSTVNSNSKLSTKTKSGDSPDSNSKSHSNSGDSADARSPATKKKSANPLASAPNHKLHQVMSQRFKFQITNSSGNAAYPNAKSRTKKRGGNFLNSHTN